MKKLPYPVYLALFLSILGLLSAGILAGVNMLTTPVKLANEKKRLEKTLEIVQVTDPEQLNIDLNAGITAVYKGIKDTKNCYVINTQNKNEFVTVRVLVVINGEDGKILDLVIESGVTSHGMDSAFINNKFGLIGETTTSKITNVSGATTSSSSVKKCVEAALSQYQTIKGGNQ